MAVSESYLSFVLEQLEALGDVTTRRMFAGVGLYCGGTFFAVIDNDTLFFKVDGALAPRYVARAMPAFAPIPGQPPMRTYYQVPHDVLEDAAQLCAWARDSVRCAAAAPTTRRARKR